MARDENRRGCAQSRVEEGDLRTGLLASRGTKKVEREQQELRITLEKGGTTGPTVRGVGKRGAQGKSYSCGGRRDEVVSIVTKVEKGQWCLVRAD